MIFINLKNMKTKIIKKNKLPFFWRGLGGGLLLLFPALLSAQNGVTVSDLAIDAGTVTFDVSWKNTGMPAVWSDTVWVFVDYNNAGKMQRLLLEAGATLTATSAPGVGKVKEEPGNNKGVWIIGDARINSSFSATVQLHTATSGVAGACAYASNYPPVARFTTNTDISFTGTAPYGLTFEYEGNIFTLPSGGTYLLPAGYTLQSFVDATGAPGIIHCFPPASPTVIDATFCFGLPGQLQAAASGNATVAWYDAPTAGNLLYSGNVLPLTPLYDNTAQYYAQAVSEDNCPSVRTQANYVLNHCVLNGYCPGFVAGSVGTISPPEACSVFDSGKIGLVNYQATCEVFYPGQIGVERYPVACVSFSAGWIGK
jgi:hypothetical protein